MRLDVPIVQPAGRLLRVLLYARYSTDEQKRSSITAQFRGCRKLLSTWGIEDAEVQELSDYEMSGELRNRPGIDQVRLGIQKRAWDLIVAEDSSRLFRNPPACCELVGDAVDLGIRVLLPGDRMDTANENSMEVLEDAQIHHSRSNIFTRNRIKRSHDELWESGAAIGMIKPGYLRRPTVPAAKGREAEGPFFDEIDPKWLPVIHEAFARVAQHQPPWIVAEWLTAAGLPKSANAKSQQWTDRNVLELIRRKVYRGEEERRKTVAKKVHRSGKSKLVRNDPEKVETRPMEHLRMVADDLWYRANGAIDGRTTNKDTPQGLDHSLAGIPRDSRGPLSIIFLCGACQEKMHMQGRRDGGYRCSHAKNGPCWNRATAYRKLTHEKISERVVAELLAATGSLDALVRHIESLLASDEPRRRRVEEWTKLVKELTEKRDRLLAAIENAESDCESLVERLRQREEELRQAKANLAAAQQEIAIVRSMPSRDEIQRHIQDKAKRLLGMDREAGAILQRLVEGPILAVPYQQFGSNKVVLRAEFKLRLVGLLPDELFTLLQQLAIEPRDLPGEVRPMTVDLFDPSGVPQHAVQACAMREAGVSRREICESLRITKRIACQAINLGKKLKEAGLVDPYIRLTEPPASASRWRTRNRRAATDGSLPGRPDAA
jgi:DNA invertase Pin-like site-specific DNA recombinase